MIVVESVVLLSSSFPCNSVIVAGELPRLKSIVLALVAAFACWTAHRKVFGVGLLAGALSAVLETTNVESSRRSSRTRTAGLNRRQSRFSLRPPAPRTDPGSAAVRDSPIPVHTVTHVAPCFSEG